MKHGNKLKLGGQTHPAAAAVRDARDSLERALRLLKGREKELTVSDLGLISKCVQTMAKDLIPELAPFILKEADERARLAGVQGSTDPNPGAPLE